MTAPYFVSYQNPIHGWQGFQNRVTFTHYEIQTVREVLHGHHFEAVKTLAECNVQSDGLGPVLYGVYGRNPDGTAEHLFDRKTKEAAEDTLTKMGVSI